MSITGLPSSPADGSGSRELHHLWTYIPITSALILLLVLASSFCLRRTFLRNKQGNGHTFASLPVLQWMWYTTWIASHSLLNFLFRSCLHREEPLWGKNLPHLVSLFFPLHSLSDSCGWIKSLAAFSFLFFLSLSLSLFTLMHAEIFSPSRRFILSLLPSLLFLPLDSL